MPTGARRYDGVAAGWETRSSRQFRWRSPIEALSPLRTADQVLFADLIDDADIEPAARVAPLEVPLPGAVSDGRSVAEATEVVAPVVTAAFAASAVAIPFFEVDVPRESHQGIENAVGAVAAPADPVSLGIVRAS